jgi:hypothetical protein
VQTTSLEQGPKLILASRVDIFEVKSDLSKIRGFEGLEARFVDDAKAAFGSDWDATKAVVRCYYHSISSYCHNILQFLELPNGFRVLWNGVKQLEIQAPTDTSKPYCGLCGGISSSDLVLGKNVNSYWGTQLCPAKSVVGKRFTEAVRERGTIFYE